MKKYKGLFIIMVVLFCSLGIVVSSACAQQNALPFSSNVQYTIYFRSSDDSAAVVERVYIFDTIVISGKTFLVVGDRRGLKGDSDEERTGFINFDAITSIIPSTLPRVKPVKEVVSQK